MLQEARSAILGGFLDFGDFQTLQPITDCMTTDLQAIQLTEQIKQLFPRLGVCESQENSRAKNNENMKNKTIEASCPKCRQGSNLQQEKPSRPSLAMFMPIFEWVKRDTLFHDVVLFSFVVK